MQIQIGANKIEKKLLDLIMDLMVGFQNFGIFYYYREEMRRRRPPCMSCSRDFAGIFFNIFYIFRRIFF